RRQLVFHVVPAPSRIGHFNEVYLREVGAPLTSRTAEAVAFLDAPRLAPTQLTPRVTTEVIAVVPAEGPIENLLLEAPPAAPPVATGWMPLRAIASIRSDWREASGGRWLTLAFVAFAAMWLLGSRPSVLAPFFERL